MSELSLAAAAAVSVLLAVAAVGPDRGPDHPRWLITEMKDYADRRAGLPTPRPLVGDAPSAHYLSIVFEDASA
jgi:hypothetical protein